MNNNKAEQLIKKIEHMKFSFPAPSCGHGVDRTTGKGDAPEEFSDEEGLIIQIQIRGEPRLRVIEGDEALQIYELVWHFLNRE